MGDHLLFRVGFREGFALFLCFVVVLGERGQGVGMWVGEFLKDLGAGAEVVTHEGNLKNLHNQS